MLSKHNLRANLGSRLVFARLSSKATLQSLLIIYVASVRILVMDDQ